MFERTFTFWRRLIGRSTAPAAESSIAVEEDRRLWVRYPADLQGHVQLSEKNGHDRLLAQVRDLSQGGANLVVEKPMAAGQMLTLELPAGQGEVHTVLACVVRSHVDADGRWSLGCVFSRELTNSDLGRVGARKTPASSADQRIWVRYECAVKANYRKYGDAPTEARPAQVLNLSATGIGMLIKPALSAGVLLNIDLFDKSGRKVCAILACIVHTTERADDESAVGCNFIRELTEEELQSLL